MLFLFYFQGIQAVSLSEKTKNDTYSFYEQKMVGLCSATTLEQGVQWLWGGSMQLAACTLN